MQAEFVCTLLRFLPGRTRVRFYHPIHAENGGFDIALSYRKSRNGAHRFCVRRTRAGAKVKTRKKTRPVSVRSDDSWKLPRLVLSSTAEKTMQVGAREDLQ